MPPLPALIRWWSSLPHRICERWTASDASDGPPLLVVEDDPPMGTFLARILDDTYTVSVVPTGRDALDWLTDHTPTLVLVDLDVPDADGIDLLQALREHPKCADVPIVVLSSTRSSQASVRCLEQGAAEYLAKPFNPEELRVRLKKLNDSLHPAPVTVPPSSSDPARHSSQAGRD